MKIVDVNKFEHALLEMEKFKSELRTQGYHKSNYSKQHRVNFTFLDYATAYLDSMSGENTPAILIRLKSKSHIDDSQRAILRFGTVLKKAGYGYSTIKLEDITDTEVSLYHEYLLNELKLQPRSYNKHIAAMRTLYNWCARVKDYRGVNPFNHVELKSCVKKEKRVITKEEFDKLLEAVTSENGLDDKTRKNHYRTWLTAAYRLALETGLRREELVRLKWSDIIPLDGGKLVFRINNLKVNRIMSGENTGEYVKSIPVTRSLMILLKELGYQEKRNTNTCIVDWPLSMEVNHIMNILTRSFSHFIKFATDRKLEFKDLRKTYITHLTIALGSNARLFTGHSNDTILKESYLSSAYMAGNLSEFKMF